MSFFRVIKNNESCQFQVLPENVLSLFFFFLISCLIQLPYRMACFGFKNKKKKPASVHK